MTFTDVTADAVNTIEWLSAANETIAVPVYQRQYRWEIDGCEQLLADIRAVATGDARQTHFFGSILYTTASSDEVTERALVDGQQRVATLMLLVAALRDTLGDSDEALAGQFYRVLLHPAVAGRTRLKLRKEGARELDSIVFGGPLPDVGVQVSHLRDNYDFFRDKIQNDALAVWDGLQKLEHVAITLHEHANAAMYPLLLWVYRDRQLGVIDRGALLEILEQLQSLYLRKMVVGASRDHLPAQLCRKRRQYGYPISAIARKTPSDERIRLALTYQELPHAGYVLYRIDEYQISDPGGLGGLGELQIEHIFPQFPTDTWSGDGTRQWHTFSEVERAKYREILSTIGNLTLLEQPLNAAASNKPFKDKQCDYAKSKVPSVEALLREPAWDLRTIAERTQALTQRFLEIWKRPPGTPDPDTLVPILDAQKKPGYYRGFKTEFEYAVFGGEVWEVRDVKSLFSLVFQRLWETNRDEVLDYSEKHGGPVFETSEVNRRFDALPGSHYLFMGLHPQWMLAEIQGILDELDMADDVFVKYSTEED
jgi:hypothetical protein